ncbi:hypothetical protein BW723_10915 [Polaribacter reichenbachii]|uniref:DUF3313 domain-containing protein n=1 Tax=Polaribacter reichenbachii TaxID=996801 RepID=A0A1B8TPW6_9FLAO|nr:hypothetical protein [Polaribacter reichenbachii]APZ46762.1 hypothetical protein BW723_10915 [Polaribacter reichenbachii]AUC17405.1 hypothetical protein BTO17_01360 [Polaribacter reichenbachii]OBY61720.1 hypothetical protein LPB301_16845 [Polaribacter reichenbachii]
MKLRLCYLLFFVFTSCSVLFPDGVSYQMPDYSFSYLTFNKRLDYNGKKYLLNSTQFGESNFNNASYLEEVVQFFKKQLRDNVKLKNDFRNSENKILIPFIIDYDVSKENIQFLKESTNIDYIILSKVLYLEDIENKSLSNVHKKKMYFSKEGAVSFIKIIDVNNGKILLEMTCTGKISKSEDKDMQTGENLNRLNLYKGSYALGEKTMKKLLKKIK